MASPDHNSRYHLVPHDAEDSDRESSPHGRLLSTPSVHSREIAIPRSCSLTFNPVLVLRLSSLSLAILSFALLVVDGGHEFIAADIFIAFTMIFNFFMVFHHSVSHIFKITVEIRNQTWKRDLGSPMRPKLTAHLDLALSVCLMFCLVIGNGIKASQYWWGGDCWIGGAVVGYVVMILQAILAVPSLDQKTLTLTARFNDVNGKVAVDTKVPVPISAMTASADIGTATRRTADNDELRQPPEVLV